MKKYILALCLISSLYATEIKLPHATLQASGAVTDMVLEEKKLYIATSASCVDVFDIEKNRLLKSIKVEKIKDFMGDIVDSKVFSVDVAKEKILILSQAEQGFARIHIHMPNTMELLVSQSQKLSIAKAKFLDENTLLIALLGNELISYDIKNKKENWRVQVSQSRFSSFALNETKSQVVIADESGDLKLYNTANGTLIKEYSNQNLDNVFQVAYKNSVIATAGQDRKVVIYDAKSGKSYHKMASFLVYSVGLSPSANLVGFSSDEHNNVTLYNTNTKSELGIYGGNKMTITNILFMNENEFLVSSDDTKVNLYKIK